MLLYQDKHRSLRTNTINFLTFSYIHYSNKAKNTRLNLHRKKNWYDTYYGSERK